MRIDKKSKWIGSILLILLLVSVLAPIPDPLFDHPYATVLESAEGQLLGARISDDGQWRFPPTDSLPEAYIKALLIYEDKYYYQHPGINPVSIIRAIKQNWKAGKIVSGGSTITMQVARMAMGNQPRTIRQKLLEIWLALRIELKYSKDEILMLYANNAPFGGNVVGLSAASWRYFSRSPYNLSLAEITNLVILPNAPGLMFPGKNDRILKAKRNRLLSKLQLEELIDPLACKLSMKEPIAQKPRPIPDLATHLLNRSIKDGFGQMRIRSSIDFNLQKSVNKIVNDYYFNLKFKQIHNASAIVADIKTGEVKAYIGNAGLYNSADHGQQVDIVDSRRSPGSLLKPFLYALAIDDGLITPQQLLPDIPMYYQGFAPKNFDKQFRGAVHAHLALRSSLNVPFVSLLKDYSYEKFHYQLNLLGLRNLDQPPGHYGLSIILGGGDVTLWELTGLYAGLVRNLQQYNLNKGAMRYNLNTFHPLSYFPQKVSDSELTSDYHISAGASWHTLKAMQMLRRPDEESGWQQFSNSRSIAWKTGTSYGHKDAWAIGLNDKYVVGIWVGNADGEGRPDLTGVITAAPLMFRVFELLKGDATFPIPMANMDFVKICSQSGQKASSICTDVSLQPLAKSAMNTQECFYHKHIHMDENESYMVNSICYPVNKMVTKSWFILPPSQARFYKKYNSDFNLPPDYKDDCSAMAEGILEMIYPRKFTKIFVPVEIDGDKGKVVFEAAHQNPEARIFWYLDSRFIGETKNHHQMGLFPDAGPHLLSLVDEQGREINLPFEATNDRQFIN